MSQPAPAFTLLAEHDWRERAVAHEQRADTLTAAHRERQKRGEKHPVEDFLWTYYMVKPGELRKWHPGAGVELEGAALERAEWRYYVTRDDRASVDVADFWSRRGKTVRYIENLLLRTTQRQPRFNCFGLHEWAMVYRMTPEQLRHTALPLRIGQRATDQVVETHQIGCSHYDAYRFFTPEAAPLNALHPTRESQLENEQAGCLHAGMDLYKWTAKIAPLVPGSLLLDCFEFARDIREVDMRASPYDVSAYTGADGAALAPIPIETEAGKKQYASMQRGFAERGNALRQRVLKALDHAGRILETS